MAENETPKPKAARGGSPEPIPAGYQVVVLSNRPDQPLLVTEAEHLDLESQGLLLQSTKEGARLRQEEGE